MSIENLLTQTSPAPIWSNLNVNSINAKSLVLPINSAILSNTTSQIISTSADNPALFSAQTITGTNISYSADSGKIFANATGNYLVTYSVTMGTSATGYVRASILVSSLGISGGYRAINSQLSQTTNSMSLSSSEVLHLTAGDGFFLALFQNSGSDMTVNTAATMTVYQLS